jgi:integrase
MTRKAAKARKIHNRKLDSREARTELEARGKPYFSDLGEPELAIGYRRLAGAAGRWCDRYYCGDRQYKTETFATADDLSVANGVDVLNWHQACDKVRERRDHRVRAEAGLGPFTVADAVALKGLPADSLAKAKAMILPARFKLHPEKENEPELVLGEIPVNDLTADMIRAWQRDLVARPAQLRSRKGSEPHHRPPANDPDVARARRSTANRLWTVLRSCLNNAFAEGRVSSDAAWKRVKPFANVDTARVRWLEVEDTRRLINAADPDFRRLIQAALLTGCRYGELGRARVRDFDKRAGTLFVQFTKPGLSKHVHLTEEGAAFFASLCAGREGDALLLPNQDGESWGASHQVSRMRLTCQRAGIKPPINFHALRHTWASLAVMNGMDLMVVAKNLGHADTRMVEKHYGHLRPGYVKDQVRDKAPTFGIEVDSTVRQFGP